ncbi:MAG TPA: hypothetical protein VFQ68_05495 [Streptosporangiaceae bacterium]|nr:hypothetical protein [Streptosporangiaceae bacterium]
MAPALSVQALLGAQGAVTLGCGELPGCLQPGLVLPIQRLPLPGRVLPGLPGLFPGVGFGLPGPAPAAASVPPNSVSPRVPTWVPGGTPTCCARAA